MKNKFVGTLKVPPKDALDYLRKLIQMHAGKTKSYSEETKDEIAKNDALIETLRNEVFQKRIASRLPCTNEYLMRQALRDHHTGSSIFREREPRDINENVDYKLCDLQKKLNWLRHERKKKGKYLKELFGEFNDAVNDAVYLELEGPMGDSSCLTLENHISDAEKKRLEGEMLQRTYKHIRDQLSVESLTNETSIQMLNTVLKHREDELSACQQAASEAVSSKETATLTAFKTEVDLHNVRNARAHRVNDLKKRNEEQKHDFAVLWKNMQSYFAAQESMPLSHVMSQQSKWSTSIDDESLEECMQNFEDDFRILEQVTGTINVKGLVARYEAQEATSEHLKAFVNELEAKKAVLLKTLEELNSDRSELCFTSESEESRMLKIASGDYKTTLDASAGNRWSLIAANSRVTQSLSRLRQLLEYLVDVFASEGLIQPPAPHDLTDTELHLRTVLSAAGAGVQALMGQLGNTDPVRAQRAAAAARFLMTRSEERLKKPRAVVEGDDADDDLPFGGGLDDGDTTGDDAAVPSRAAIKQQAQVILQAKQKSGFSRKKRP